jgi:hypothetical protein
MLLICGEALKQTAQAVLTIFLAAKGVRKHFQVIKGVPKTFLFVKRVLQREKG